MKNKMLYTIFVLTIPFLSGCSTSQYEISSIEMSKPDVYTIDTTSYVPSLIKNDETSSKIPVYNINKKDIPFIDLSTGVDLFINFMNLKKPDEDVKYSHTTDNNQSNIINTNNNSHCVIDYKKQTFTFDDYMAFVCNVKDATTPLDSSCSDSTIFKDVKKVTYEAPKNPLVIDLKKYDIPVYNDGKEGYIPLEIYCNILCSICGNIFSYANGTLYMLAPKENLQNKLILNKKINAKFSSNYMKYCYNLAALTLDIEFGLRERKSRAVMGPSIKYNIDGYTNLNKQDKNNFLSTLPNVANQALVNTLFDSYDDGGHTGYFGASFIDDTAPIFKIGDEYKLTATISSKFTPVRANYNLSPSQTTGKSDAIGDFKIYEDGKNNDTAFLTMDAFKPVDFTADYYCGTNTLVRYANEQLRTEDGKKVKNLVIDLSLNGGGSVWTERFMDSWLTRGNSHAKMCCNLTGAFSDISYKADIDGDGNITENDYLPNTVEKIYFILTPGSFSCANLLPCQVKDYGSNVHFIGNNSGGGACFVRDYLLTGYGSFYQVSSQLCACRKDATTTEFITNDSGVGVNDNNDYSIALSNPDGYYNRNDIVNFIHK